MGKQKNDENNQRRWWQDSRIHLAVGIIGIILGVLIPYVTKKEKVPCYYIESRSLVTTSNMDKISVSYGGKNVPRVTSTNISLWNSGGETIRRNDIADNDPLRILSPPNVRVLDAKIIKMSRRPIHGQLRTNSREVSVTFDFLDKNDGLVIQILHTGSANTSFQVVGTIISARSLHQFPIKNCFNGYVAPILFFIIMATSSSMVFKLGLIDRLADLIIDRLRIKWLALVLYILMHVVFFLVIVFVAAWLITVLSPSVPQQFQ